MRPETAAMAARLRLITVNGTIAAARIRTNGGDDLANANTGGAAGLITINTGNGNQITLRDDLFAAGGTGATAGAGSDVTLSDAVLLANDISISRERRPAIFCSAAR